MKTLNEIELYDLTPDSIKDDAKVKAAGEAITPQLKAVSESVDAPLIYKNFESLSSLVYDHLARQWSVPVWRESWTNEMKASVLREEISAKRIKGTVSAVKNAIAGLGYSVRLVEWWEMNPKGDPHTFFVFIDLGEAEEEITAQTQNEVVALIDDAKPVRSHYTIQQIQKMKSGLGLYGTARGVTYIRNRTNLTFPDSATLEGGISVVAAAKPVSSRWLVMETK